MARQQLILDRYLVVGQAGAGGFATVKHAYDTHLKRDVAIKCIKLSEAEVARAHLLAMEERLQREAESAEDASAGDAEATRVMGPVGDGLAGGGAAARGAAASGAAASNAPVARRTAVREPLPWEDDPVDLTDDDLFDHIPGLAEAQTVAKLNDSNIVTVYDCAVSGDVAYIIMEYVEGKTLAQIMHEVGDDISLDVVASVFTSVAHALEVAHDANVLHLDIKPENVIVNKKGVVKVTDFGLAALVDAGGRGKTGGGTIGYMPLEQMRQEPLDVRTDEWALASLTYEMLSGTNPFRARTLEAAEEAIEEAELVLPSLCWDALDAAADDMVFTALDPDPDERYDSVSAFAEELTPLLGSTRAGKRALAAIVNGEEPAADPEPAPPREPQPPLIDRMGPVGASVVSRVLAVASTSMVGAVALVNVRIDPSAIMGLASDNAVVFWVVLAAMAVLAAFRPAFGALAAWLAFSIMLLANFAFAPGLVLLVATGAWWWFVGRRGEGQAVSALLQPLCGAVGFGAMAPIAAGALLGVREAAATAAFAAASALAFASLGSCSLMSWDIGAHVLTSASREIAGPQITEAFLATLSMPATWFIAASWILAAVLFALFCHRGTRAFDIAGACAAAAVLLVGAIASMFAGDIVGAGVLGAGLSADLSTGATGPSAAMTVLGALAPGAVGIALAAMSVCDRVRLAEGEW